MVQEVKGVLLDNGKGKRSYVKRSGHCSEYEEQKKKIDTP